MQEPNETTQNPLPKQEICSIRIMFPVTSDEQAFEYKKRISAAVADIAAARLEFSVMDVPIGLPHGSPIR